MHFLPCRALALFCKESSPPLPVRAAQSFCKMPDFWDKQSPEPSKPSVSSCLGLLFYLLQITLFDSCDTGREWWKKGWWFENRSASQGLCLEDLTHSTIVGAVSEGHVTLLRVTVSAGRSLSNQGVSRNSITLFAAWQLTFIRQNVTQTLQPSQFSVLCVSVRKAPLTRWPHAASWLQVTAQSRQFRVIDVFFARQLSIPDACET